MAETVNIGDIASLLSKDIFAKFHWTAHKRRDENFVCHDDRHTSKGKKPQKKLTHPGDVIFYYEDPYIGRRIYLHTDLKSYAKTSISAIKIRSAIESLAMTVECAQSSAEWRKAYSVPDDGNFDIRGLLFVHNHDGKHLDEFDRAIANRDLGTIPIPPNVYIHFVGPKDISRLYTIANDIMRLEYEKIVPENYSFYYPDLVMWRRSADIAGQAATIEALTAPYFILTYEARDQHPNGFVIYYNRPGASSAEFEYFIDSLSRYQLLEADKSIRIRMVDASPDEHFLSNFSAAKEKYVKAWGLDPSRRMILDNIRIERVTAVSSTYNAPEIGWRDS